MSHEGNEHGSSSNEHNHAQQAANEHNMMYNCRWFGSAQGCRHEGNKCPFNHSNPNSVPFCAFYDKDYPQSCRNGNGCPFRHQDWSQSIDNEKHMQLQPLYFQNSVACNDEMEAKWVLIIGFIRSIVDDMPADMIDIILSYYFQPFWSNALSHPMMQIDDTMIMNAHGHGTISAFSAESVCQGKATWKLKIIRMTGEILIGVMPHPQLAKANEKFWRLDGGIAYYNRGDINFNRKQNEYAFPQFCKYGTMFGANDTITVHLDMDSDEVPQLSFSVNCVNQGRIAKNIQIKKATAYYLGVGIECEGDIVAIVE